MGNYAYTTLLATDDYVYGVLGLFFSLKEVQAQYPLHVIVTSNISENIIAILDEVGVLYTVMPRVDFKSARGMHEIPYALTLNKMHLFDLVQYDKVCFIDGDAVLKDNIDRIFEMDPPGFIVFGSTFLSGVLMLFDPKMHTFKKLYQKFQTAGTDEVIINTIYSASKVTDLVEFFNSIVHLSHGGTGTQYKYWQLQHLDSIEKIQKYIQKEHKCNYINLHMILEKTYIDQQEACGLLAP